jgi:hypothetical protein
MRQSRSRTSRAIAIALALVALTAGIAFASDQKDDEEAATLKEALAKGKPIINLRYRFENVSQDDFEKDAHASTLRTVIGYESKAYRGFSLYAEAVNVTSVGNDLYNNAGRDGNGNGVTDRPVVADPALTKINQALARYKTGAWKFGLGRQEITYGDHRFVGNVLWRQHHQSFDAFRVDADSLGPVKISYAYTDRVNRIFGDSLDLSAHLSNFSADIGTLGKLTFSLHLLDYGDPSFLGLSTATYGLELAGNRPLSDSVKFLYEAQYAQQDDYGDNPTTVDAQYSFLMLGADFQPVTVKLAWEVLGGSLEDGAFITPLATLHKFNGWADKFLNTPPTGLVDLYLQLGGKAGPIDWIAKYHDFSSDSGSIDYGTELDFQLLYKAACGAVVGLKGAIYDADQFSVDTEKFWVWTAYKF